jgi:hypothetical protein
MLCLCPGQLVFIYELCEWFLKQYGQKLVKFSGRVFQRQWKEKYNVTDKTEKHCVFCYNCVVYKTLSFKQYYEIKDKKYFTIKWGKTTVFTDYTQQLFIVLHWLVYKLECVKFKNIRFKEASINTAF